MALDENHLVTGRTCGTCAVCCIEFTINEGSFQKPAGMRCPNLTEQNQCCAYETRPQTCRNFHCGWRMAAGLGDEWRPDRSGVVIRVLHPNGQASAVVGWEFLVTGPPQTLLWPPLADVLGKVTQFGIAATLSVPKLGQFRLKPVTAANDIRFLLTQIHTALNVAT